MSLLFVKSFFMRLHYRILKFNDSSDPIAHEKFKKFFCGTVRFTVPIKL